MKRLQFCIIKVIMSSRWIAIFTSLVAKRQRRHSMTSTVGPAPVPWITGGQKSTKTHFQGGAGHSRSPEQGKRAKIFLEKGLFRAQNRAKKPDVKEFFDVEEHLNSKN